MNQHANDAFAAVKESLLQPGLDLTDPAQTFSVVCDASDFAIGCALLQDDPYGHDSFVANQSRQLKYAGNSFFVHYKELLTIEYAIVKTRVHLLGSKRFVIDIKYA